MNRENLKQEIREVADKLNGLLAEIMLPEIF